MRSYRAFIVRLCGAGLLLLALPFIAHAQEESPIPLAQLVTSDQRLSMAYPEGWTISADVPGQTGFALFSDESVSGMTPQELQASGETSIRLSFFAPDEVIQNFGTTDGSAESVLEALRAYIIAQTTGQNGETVTTVSDIESIPADGTKPALWRITINNDIGFASLTSWDIPGGLTGSAWVETSEANWAEFEPVLDAMLQSALYLGPESPVQIEVGE